MFFTLLLTAAIASTPQISTQENNTQEEQELQEIIALFTQEETTPEKSSDTVTIAQAETSISETAPIQITNAIEPSMLAYKHWTGKYSPETFTITINGTEVAQGESYELKKADDSLEISYAYSFMKGMHSGEKTVSYKLNENSTQAHITFSWKDNPKVQLDNGTVVKEVTA